MKQQDKINEACKQGQAQFDSIREMIDDLSHANAAGDEQAIDACRTRIHEDALSAEVRSNWYVQGRGADTQPYEYRILLCTGGPACQITGTLSEHGEPETATMQVQDWGTPWTDMRPLVSKDDYNSEPILLVYASQFYFGE